MKTLLALTLMFTFAGAAHAKKSCTEEPKEKWMSEADFKKKAEAYGYVISKFKTPGTCYEIYGKDKEGKKVEVYFNPVDGSVVKKFLD